MALSDAAVRSAKPQPRPVQLSDGDGLHLLVPPPAGGRLWRLGYRFGGKQKQPALGAYPAVGSFTCSTSHVERPAWFGFLRTEGLDPRALEPFVGTIDVAPCRFTPPLRRFYFDPAGGRATFFQVFDVEDGDLVVVDLVAFDLADTAGLPQR